MCTHQQEALGPGPWSPCEMVTTSKWSWEHDPQSRAALLLSLWRAVRSRLRCGGEGQSQASATTPGTWTFRNGAENEQFPLTSIVYICLQEEGRTKTWLHAWHVPAVPTPPAARSALTGLRSLQRATSGTFFCSAILRNPRD